MAVQAKEKGTQLIDEEGLFALVRATEHLAPEPGAAAASPGDSRYLFRVQGLVPWVEVVNLIRHALRLLATKLSPLSVHAPHVIWHHHYGLDVLSRRNG